MVNYKSFIILAGVETSQVGARFIPLTTRMHS